MPQEDQYSLARATAKLPASRLPPSSVALPFTGTSGARQSLAVGCTGEYGQMSLIVILGENVFIMMMQVGAVQSAITVCVLSLFFRYHFVIVTLLLIDSSLLVVI